MSFPEGDTLLGVTYLPAQTWSDLLGDPEGPKVPQIGAQGRSGHVPARPHRTCRRCGSGVMVTSVMVCGQCGPLKSFEVITSFGRN